MDEVVSRSSVLASAISVQSMKTIQFWFNKSTNKRIPDIITTADNHSVIKHGTCSYRICVDSNYDSQVKPRLHLNGSVCYVQSAVSARALMALAKCTDEYKPTCPPLLHEDWVRRVIRQYTCMKQNKNSRDGDTESVGRQRLAAGATHVRPNRWQQTEDETSITPLPVHTNVIINCIVH